VVTTVCPPWLETCFVTTVVVVWDMIAQWRSVAVRLYDDEDLLLRCLLFL
jgi:hypothetical protein